MSAGGLAGHWASATPFLHEICGGSRSRGRWGRSTSWVKNHWALSSQKSVLQGACQAKRTTKGKFQASMQNHSMIFIKGITATHVYENVWTSRRFQSDGRRFVGLFLLKEPFVPKQYQPISIGYLQRVLPPVRDTHRYLTLAPFNS